MDDYCSKDDVRKAINMEIARVISQYKKSDGSFEVDYLSDESLLLAALQSIAIELNIDLGNDAWDYANRMSHFVESLWEYKERVGNDK